MAEKFVVISDFRRRFMLSDFLMSVLRRHRPLWRLCSAWQLWVHCGFSPREAWNYAGSLAETAFDPQDGWWLGDVPTPREALLTDMGYWEGE